MSRVRPSFSQAFLNRLRSWSRLSFIRTLTRIKHSPRFSSPDTPAIITPPPRSCNRFVGVRTGEQGRGRKEMSGYGGFGAGGGGADRCSDPIPSGNLRFAGSPVGPLPTQLYSGANWTRNNL